MAFYKGLLETNFSELNKETFESVVGLGRSKKEVIESFKYAFIKMAREEGVIKEDEFEVPGGFCAVRMDQWCYANYGMPFLAIYDVIQNVAYNSYLDMMSELSVRGNPMAQSLMNEFILKKKENSVVAINFVNTLEMEKEEDKEDDEK